jgi:uncharacterized protein (DUF58 family)
MLPILALLQAAAPAPAPDIELNVHIRAKRVTIEQQGEAKLIVHAEPDGGASRVETSVQPKPEGRRELRNVTVDVHAQASLAEPSQNRADVETAPPR